MKKPMLIITTINEKKTAEEIGRQLLEKRLASCIQISGPIKSIYWWKGKIEETEEWACVFKSTASLYKKVEREIKHNHPYEIPEITGIYIDKILPEYKKWLMEETDLLNNNMM